MARLEPAPRKGIVRRLTYRTAQRMYGRPMEPTGVVAHHKPLLIAYGAVGLVIERYSNSVDERLKHLATLRVSQLAGCEWCLDFGSMLAQKSGIPADTLRELGHWRSSAQFDDLDKLVLEYAEAMTRTPVEVSDELFARLRAHFSEAQVVELTAAVALENFRSKFNVALGIEAQGFCVLPR
jgi:AhpD family alkylhydroperoxidase